MSQVDFLINIKTKGAEFISKYKNELGKTAGEVGKLSAEQNKLASSSKKVSDDLTKTNKALFNMKESTAAAASSFKTMGLGLLGGATAAILSVGAITAKVGELTENFQQLDQWSKKLNLPIGEIQAMEQVARKAGVEFEQMGDNIYDAAIKIEEAIIRKSGPAFEALQELGLKEEDFKGLSSLERVVKFQEALSKIPASQRAFYLDELSLKDSQIAIANLKDVQSIVEKLRQNGTLISPVDQARMNEFLVKSKDNAIQLDNAFQKMIINTLPNVSILMEQIRGSSDNMIDKSTIDETSTAMNVLLAIANSLLAVVKIVFGIIKNVFDTVLNFIGLVTNIVLDSFGSMYDTIVDTFNKIKLLYLENKLKQTETFSLFDSDEENKKKTDALKKQIKEVKDELKKDNATNNNFFDKIGLSLSNFGEQSKGEADDVKTTWVNAGNSILDTWRNVFDPAGQAAIEQQRLDEQEIIKKNNELLEEKKKKSEEAYKVDDKAIAKQIADLKVLRDIQEAGGEGGITNFSYTKQAAKIYTDIIVSPTATTEQKNNAKLAKLQLEKEFKLKIDAGIDIKDIEDNLKELDLKKITEKMTDDVYNKKKVEEYQKVVDRQGASELQKLTAKAEIQKIINGEQKGTFAEVDRIEKTYKAGQITDEQRVKQLREALTIISATAAKAEDRLDADVRLNELNTDAFKTADLIRKQEAAGVKTKQESVRLQKIEYENIIKTSTKQEDILEAQTRLLGLKDSEFEIVDMIDKKYQAYGTSRAKRDEDTKKALQDIINTSQSQENILEATLRLRTLETEQLQKQHDLTRDLENAQAKLLKINNDPVAAFEIEAKQRMDDIELRFKGTKDYVERLKIEEALINEERFQVQLEKIKKDVEKAKDDFGKGGFFNFDESVAQSEKLIKLKQDQIDLETKHGKAIEKTGALSLFTNQKIAELMGQSLDIMASSLSNLIFRTEDTSKIVKQMLADILTEINKVILRQIAMNVAASFSNGAVGGGFGSVFSSLVAAMGRNHTGGIVGRDAFSGQFGLKNNETMRVLEDDEGVFTAEQMRALGGRNKGSGVAMFDTERSAEALFRSSSMKKNLSNWNNDQNF